jgi:(+)-pinoresinol hydroxylase
MRWAWTTLVVFAVAVPALAASSQQRAMPGAGWSSAAVPGRAGEAVYRRYCWACHGEGPDHPGTDALRAKYRGSLPELLHKRNDLSVEYVVLTVRHGVNVMPAARKTEISDTELNAIAEYLARKRR